MSRCVVLHAGFTVADAVGTAEFLRDCLGFEITEPRKAPPDVLGRIIGVPGADATVIYATAGGMSIELLQYRPPRPVPSNPRQPDEVGFAHFAVCVDSVDEVVAAAARRGFTPAGTVTRIPAGPHGGRNAVYIRDPNGFTIELMGN